MRDLEKIEEAAFDLFLNESGDMSKYRGRALAIELATSDEAKEFHQQGMYSKEEVKNAFDSGMGYIISQLSYFSSDMDTSKGFGKWLEDNKKKTQRLLIGKDKINEEN